MLDVGWTELVVIAIVLIIVVGPKDLPPMLRTFGKMMTKMRGMANDFRQQFDEALKEADLDDVRRTLSDAQKLNPAHSLREAMNPLRQMGNEIKADLQKATAVETTPADDAAAAPAEVPAEAVVPQEQPKAAPVAAAVVAAAMPVDRAAAISAPVEEPKAKRVSKPKAAAVGAAVSAPAKAAGKKAKTVAAKLEVRKAAATKKKGDA
ncbi:Sec-independent protein translocase protein TatB [Pararhizobium sp. LjRoot255]|uniref:Sec-independent protein translocase protein TatB n=1 Tax=Pararhizobium sp. LjRoot255 TaxID=3342298 RepID=UPI003ED0D175